MSIKPVTTRFVRPSELVKFSPERQTGYFEWLHSKEGKQWVEDMNIKEYQFRRICSEQGCRCLSLRQM